MNRHVFAVVALTFVVASPAAHAADPAIASRIRETIATLEQAYPPAMAPPAQTDDLAAYAEQMTAQRDAATHVFDGASAKMSDQNLQAEPELWSQLVKAHEKLGHLQAHLMVLASYAEALVRYTARHKQGERLKAELDSTEAYMTRDEGTLREDGWTAPHFAALRKLEASVRAADDDVLKAQQRQQAQAQASQAAHALGQATRDRAEELIKKALAGSELGEDELAKLEADIATIEQDTPGAGFYRHFELVALRVLQRWQRPDSEAAIAQLLEGTAVAHGRSSGKALDVTIAADPGRCYLLLGMFAAQADASGIADFAWHNLNGDQVQEFHIKPFPGLAEGFCTVGKKVSPVAHAGLAFQGSKNGLRWLVLSFARDHFPAELSAGLVIERGDQCDAAYWEAIWSHPLPGTLAYDGRQPVLLLDGRGHEVLRLNDPTTLASPGVLTSKPTGSILFTPSELEWGDGCPTNQKAWLPARSATSLKLVACFDRVVKKYGVSWDQIEGQRAAARDAGGIAPAVENRATALMKQQERDSAACSAIEAGVHKTISKVNERLIDLYLSTPPTDDSGRAERFERANAHR